MRLTMRRAGPFLRGARRRPLLPRGHAVPFTMRPLPVHGPATRLYRAACDLGSDHAGCSQAQATLVRSALTAIYHLWVGTCETCRPLDARCDGLTDVGMLPWRHDENEERT